MKTPSVLANSLRYGGIVTVVIAVVGGTVTYLVAGFNGLVSALLGAVLTAVFLGLTAISIIIASRVTRNNPSSGGYFGVIAGVWLVKFALFVVAIIVLRHQPWLNSTAFIVVLIVAVIATLISDAFALQRTRVSYVGDIELPGSPPPPAEPRG